MALTPFDLSEPALAAARILDQLAAPDLDATQPVAGGGDIAYPAAAAVRRVPRARPGAGR